MSKFLGYFVPLSAIVISLFAFLTICIIVSLFIYAIIVDWEDPTYNVSSPLRVCNYSSAVYKIEIELLDAQTKSFIPDAHIGIRDARPHEPYEQLRDCKRRVPVSPIDDFRLKELNNRYVGIVRADVPFQEINLFISAKGGSGDTLTDTG